MAAGVSLKMKFDTMSGSRTWTFANAKQTATLENIRALAGKMIENASLFQYQPIKMTDARTVTVTENVYDLDA